MSTSKRHHYNPRYYLKGFENDEGKLWRLDIETGHIAPGSHDVFGLKKHWNSLKEVRQDYESDWLEKRIGIIDSAASKELATLLSGRMLERLVALPFAISFMQNHQPRVKQHAAEEAPEVLKGWSDDFYMVTSAKNAIIQADEYSSDTFSVSVIDEASDMRFLTSSNPLVAFSNRQMKVFPLSSRMCLILNCPEKDAGHFIPVGPVTVQGINTLTLENSWQYVFSSTPHFDP